MVDNIWIEDASLKPYFQNQISGLKQLEGYRTKVSSTPQTNK
jgi:hypothetical protein